MSNPQKAEITTDSTEPWLESITLTAAHGIQPASHQQVQETLEKSHFHDLSQESTRRIIGTIATNGRQGEVEVHLESTESANYDQETDYEVESDGKIDLIRIKITFEIRSHERLTTDYITACMAGIEEVERLFESIGELGPLSLTYRLGPEKLSLEFREHHVQGQKVEIFDSNIRVPMVKRDELSDVHERITDNLDCL